MERIRMRAKYKKKMSFMQKTAAVLLICLVLGLAVGIVQAALLTDAKMSGIENQLDLRFQGDIRRADLFMSSVIKNGGIMLLIWLLAFLPMGDFAACAILLIKAAGYSFTMAVLIRTYGGAGFFYSVFSLGVQAVILLSAAFLLSFVNINFGALFRNKNINLTGKQFIEYFILLLIAEACVVLAAVL